MISTPWQLLFGRWGRQDCHSGARLATGDNQTRRTVLLAALGTRSDSQQCPLVARLKMVHLTSAHSAFDVRIFHKECKALRQHGYEVVQVARHVRDEEVDGVLIKAVPMKGQQ